MQLAKALLSALKDHGAREIFGIPGDFVLPFFQVIEESGILPLYTLSHEPSLGFAADASARFNRSLGVAAVTYGAGALNLVNAVAGACADSTTRPRRSTPSSRSIRRSPATRRGWTTRSARPRRSPGSCATRWSARCRSIWSCRGTG
jgi:hypothetical protein